MALLSVLGVDDGIVDCAWCRGHYCLCLVLMALLSMLGVDGIIVIAWCRWHYCMCLVYNMALLSLHSVDGIIVRAWCRWWHWTHYRHGVFINMAVWLLINIISASISDNHNDEHSVYWVSCHSEPSSSFNDMTNLINDIICWGTVPQIVLSITNGVTSVYDDHWHFLWAKGSFGREG